MVVNKKNVFLYGLWVFSIASLTWYSEFANM
jgi:hypothetical protein